MPNLTYLRLPAAAALAFALAACGGQDEDAVETNTRERPVADRALEASESEPSLRELIESEPRFSVLYEVLEAADLLTTFENQGPLTLFAPSNEAFAKLPDGYSVEVLSAPENRELLRNILAYHVVSGEVTAASIAGQEGEADTLTGDRLAYDGSGTVVVIGTDPSTAVVTIADLEAENGIIHVIDAVLLPPA
jgi:uncharacterized surface protein with fasciclin (FAS1) repeats